VRDPAATRHFEDGTYRGRDENGETNKHITAYTSTSDGKCEFYRGSSEQCAFANTSEY
jgi:hypothetical protein